MLLSRYCKCDCDFDDYLIKFMPFPRRSTNFVLFQQNPKQSLQLKQKSYTHSFSPSPRTQFTSFYDHTYSPEKDSMTWRLDYDKTSDFDDVSGHWHLESHPSKPNCTRVFYACDIKLKGAVPGPVVNFVSKSALKAATGWVKKESESHASETLDLAFVDKSKMKAETE